ncbi:MAG TPA: type II toxin-antitoxin system HicA family toxin [Candidatus Fraserbacteria bacterium]|nr:type II toxin-antitoxin system HicA family toxin [Candidatus Fraserbacteria bacterium]
MTTRLRGMKYSEVTKRLKRLGFRFYRQGKGSHELWVRDSDGKAIPVPRYQSKEIRKGTVARIIKEIGLTVKEFMELA